MLLPLRSHTEFPCSWAGAGDKQGKQSWEASPGQHRSQLLFPSEDGPFPGAGTPASPPGQDAAAAHRALALPAQPTRRAQGSSAVGTQHGADPDTG